ncbi:MAG: response regulator [Xenococcaceae cyanobacterium MO_207.B15]|nr:response regulator [Xenococcaceae cyanobacterium MO_207.B15]
MIIQNCNQPINILLAEDNPGDVYLISSILDESQISYNLHHVLNGEEIMVFLHQQGQWSNISRPDLILLDLNLPLKHGFEVLEEIKSTPKIKMILVIILTSSTAERDILKSYNLFASCYLSKPVDLNEFINTLKSLENFWLRFVKLPPQLESPNN